MSESTLRSHINAVRGAVGDNGEDQRLIRTVQRKGFRFVGPVVDEEEEVASGVPDVPADGVPPVIATPLPKIEPAAGQDPAMCGYQVRAISIEKS